MGTVWTVIVAAGEGRRFGGQKQFDHLLGRPVVEWSIVAAQAVADGVVLVVPADRIEDRALNERADVVVAGGATRSDSVRAGLAGVPDDAEIVLVHDAARPLASASLFEAVVAKLRSGATGVVPGVAVTDTIKRVDGERVVETLDRTCLVAIQTPQGFLARALRHAHESLDEATDDATLVEACGFEVVVIPGEVSNRKITDPVDFEFCASLIRAGEWIGVQDDEFATGRLRIRRAPVRDSA